MAHVGMHVKTSGPILWIEWNFQWIKLIKP